MPQQDSGRIARDSSVHQRPVLVLTSNRACSGAVKNPVVSNDRVKVELVGVSEVLGLSGVRAEPEEVNV